MPDPGVSFRELFAYTDYLATRWMNYFSQHPAALDVSVGGKTGSVRDLVNHIFQVEQFFAGHLLQVEMPSPSGNSSDTDGLLRMHAQAHDQLLGYINSAGADELSRVRSFSRITGSARKLLTQTALHSVHHWAQIAMEVRQAGFLSDGPQDIVLTNVME